MSEFTPVALAQAGLLLVVAAVVAWLVPSLAMKRLVPALGAGPLVTNYRGEALPAGLGAVWPIWAVSVTLAGQLVGVVGSGVTESGSVWHTVETVLAVPALLAVGSFAFGLMDDTFGTSADKGFRGHLRALRRGRLTTGGLKLFGIGLLAAAAIIPAAPSEPTASAWLGALAFWVLQVLAIALTANLINLLDLRPGRALKAYSVLVVLALLVAASRWYALERGGVDAVVTAGWLLAGWLVVYLGPALAVFRFDLGESAMLGDGGSNPAGAVAGYLVAVTLPWWALVAYVGLVLFANLASERHSFSAVIERNGALKWIDRLGRLPQSEHTSAPGTPEADDG